MARRAMTIAVVMGLGTVAHAGEAIVDAGQRDGFLSVASDVPARGALVVATNAGAMPSMSDDTLATERALGVMGFALVWAMTDRLAAHVAADWQYGHFSPTASVRAQLLDDIDGPVNLTTAVRVRALGFEGAGSQIAALIAAGRRFDRLEVGANVGIGKGVAGRDDVDAEGALLANYAVARNVRVGIEGRTRTELVDVYITEEDFGRAFELTGGVTGAFEQRSFVLQALAGWSSPRGIALAGPVALIGALFLF